MDKVIKEEIPDDFNYDFVIKLNQSAVYSSTIKKWTYKDGKDFHFCGRCLFMFVEKLSEALKPLEFNEKEEDDYA